MRILDEGLGSDSWVVGFIGGQKSRWVTEEAMKIGLESLS